MIHMKCGSLAQSPQEALLHEKTFLMMELGKVDPHQQEAELLSLDAA